MFVEIPKTDTVASTVRLRLSRLQIGPLLAVCLFNWCKELGWNGKDQWVARPRSMQDEGTAEIRETANDCSGESSGVSLGAVL